MSVKLLTEHNLEFLSLKGARLSLHLSKCHIVGNHMRQLKILSYYMQTLYFLLTLR